MNTTQEAVRLLEMYPGAVAVYMSADNQWFTDRNAVINHTNYNRLLPYQTFTREELFKKVTDKKKQDIKEDLPTAKEDAPSASEDKYSADEIIAMNPNEVNHLKKMSILKRFDIKPENNKKDAVNTAFVELQNKLKSK